MTKIENMKNTAHMLEKRSAMMLEQARQEVEIPADVEKFLDLLHDEAFRTDFMNCASAEAVKELLDRNGIPFTMEDIDAMLMAISATLQKLDENNGELTEEDLEQIAGGWSWGCFFRPLREFCVSDFRQNQEYHVINVQDEGLFPLSTFLPEGWDGMRAGTA